VDPGRPGPLFLAKSILFFLHCIQCLKNIFEIEFWFYSGRNPRSLWKCGGCMRVCVSVWSHRLTRQISRFLSNISGFRKPLLFCSEKAQFWMISDAILIPKIYARLQEIASNFSKFSGEAPRPPAVIRFRALLPYRPLLPFQNSWIRLCTSDHIPKMPTCKMGTWCQNPESRLDSYKADNLAFAQHLLWRRGCLCVCLSRWCIVPKRLSRSSRDFTRL